MTLRRTAWLMAAVACALPHAAAPAASQAIIEVAPRAAPARPADRSGQTRETRANVLSDPALANAAALGLSGLLPQGTTARVQNLQNGRSTFIQIRPGGASSEGRLLDITPPVARALGVTGTSAQVRVAPLAVPQPDGTIRLGEGTRAAGVQAAPALSDRPQD